MKTYTKADMWAKVNIEFRKPDGNDVISYDEFLKIADKIDTERFVSIDYVLERLSTARISKGYKDNYLAIENQLLKAKLSSTHLKEEQ